MKLDKLNFIITNLLNVIRYLNIVNIDKSTILILFIKYNYQLGRNIYHKLNVYN